MRGGDQRAERRQADRRLRNHHTREAIVVSGCTCDACRRVVEEANGGCLLAAAEALGWPGPLQGWS